MRSHVMAPAGKFHPPSAGAGLVHRKAIGDWGNPAAGTARLVLVRAPAGFGKTTALRQIQDAMEAAGIATAWMTLDAADNDVPRFLSCLAEAVARLQVDDRALQLSDHDTIGLLGEEAQPFALFLDEFEMLQSPAAMGVLRDVIDYLPRNGRLVIGTRNLPDLGLGRLRVRGQLLEIGVETLRFSRDETLEFLGKRGLSALPPDTLDLLQERTEGWAAALTLACAALAQPSDAADFIRRLSGSGSTISEYLAEDVLARQPPDVRDFLLRTSVLHQLTPSLCRSLLPQIDCARMLERINASSLFLSQVDDAGPEPVYRFHSLFATFLRAQLAREHPAALPQLHLKAAAWYEAAGRAAPAIDHAIAGGDDPYAITLLTGHAQRFLEQGRMRLLARWFSTMQPQALEGQPLMLAFRTWAVLFTQGAEDAMRQLADSGIERSDDPVIRAHVNALRPLSLAMVDRYAEAHEIGRLSMDRLPTVVPFADTVLTNCMAHITSVMGEKREAQRLLDDARRTQNSSVFNRMYTEATEGMLDIERGRVRQATARLRIAVDATTREGDYSHTSGNAWAGVMYATVMYEANQLDVVGRLLHVYLPLARDVGLPDHMISSYAMRSRLDFLRGDVDAASRALTEQETLGHLRKLPRVVATAKLERARMLLMQGNAQGAREELDRADDAEVWQRLSRQRLPAHELLDMTVSRLRWDVHFGDAAEAVRRIDQVLPQLAADLRIRRSRKMRVLKGLALWRLQQPADATAVFHELLVEGSRENFMRLVLDEGPGVAGPIHAVHQQLAGRGADPILLDYVQRMLAALGPHARAAAEAAESPAPDAPLAAEVPWQVEPLTQKEVQVLQLLAEGYSNSAMSEKLFVSDSTVRTHLRNINMKLGAQNRTQAVSLARRYGLLR